MGIPCHTAALKINSTHTSQEPDKYTATIVFGGMGSKCDSGDYKNLLAKLKEGLGQQQIDCYENTIDKGMKVQAQDACKRISESDYYKKASEINLVGVSQGGLMARYILEECDISAQTKFRNLLTIGTPNMGVSEITKSSCATLPLTLVQFCEMANGAMLSIAYSDMMQNSIAPAGYLRNTNNLQEYKAKSTFLPWLNNEVGEGTESFNKHKARFESLNQAMFVLFEKDEIVFPPISEFFGEQSAGILNRKEIPMEETEIFQKNSLGQQTLKNLGKIQLVKINDLHVKFSDWDITNTFIPFLKR